MAFLEQTPVLRCLEPSLHIAGHQEAVGRVPVDVVAAGLVGLGLQGDADAGDRVHGLGEPGLEPLPHAVVVVAEGVLVAVDAGPDHSELGIQLPVKLQGLDGTIYGMSSDLRVGVAEAAPLVSAVVEEEGDGRDEPDARLLLQVPVQVEVILVDLVGVVGLHGEGRVHVGLVAEPSHLVEGVLQGAPVDVGLVEPASAGVEVPDAGAVSGLESVALEVSEGLLV